MASRVSESTYWDSQQLPSASQYSQHYYATTPATSIMSQQQQQQQQPRQAPPPLNHPMHGINTSENQAVYAGPTSSLSSSSASNSYYGPVYSTSMSGGGGIGGNYSHVSASNGNHSHGATAGGGGGSINANGTSNSGGSSMASQGGNHGGSTMASQGGNHGGPHHGFPAHSHGMLPLSATQMTSSPYPPVGSNYPSYHLSSNGGYNRSHPGDGDNGMSQGIEGLHQQPSHSFPHGGHHHGNNSISHHHNYHHSHHQLPLPAIQQQQPQQQQQQAPQPHHQQQSLQHHQSQQPQQQRPVVAAAPPAPPKQEAKQDPTQSTTYQGSSQHSGSPTLDGSDYGAGGMKPKRRQVKNACINCQKACKRCDEGRPCTRCIKYGLVETCQDSARKERKRGIKRGPYKRRATTGSQPNSASSLATSHFSQSSPFGVENAMSSAPYLGHHSNSTPQLRTYKAEDSHGGGSGGGAPGTISNGHSMDQGMLNSPVYPSSAPNTVQRVNAPLHHSDSPYMRSGLNGIDGFQGMQPPRFTRLDYERGFNSPSLSPFNMMGHRANALPPPISAPASSMTFSSGVMNNGYNSNHNSRSLFSPPSFMGNNNASSAHFLHANGQHHRLNSDSSLNTLATNTTQSNSSLSPRTPMTLSANSSASLINGLDLIGGQPLSANSAMSSPGGINTKFGSNGNNYVHHPGPTTTLNLPSTATGAFLNPPSTPSSNAFPLHIPHSARWRSGNGNVQSTTEFENKEEQLAPIKLVSSNDSEMSGGTISGRYQLPSPRIAEIPRGIEMRSGMPKMEQGPSAMPTGA